MEAIEIALGSTYSCVGVFRSKRTTPSYVEFADTERLIGDSAKNQVTESTNYNLRWETFNWTQIRWSKE